MPDVVVIGAGIVGCSAAAFLAEGGADVVVVDRAGVAAGASGRNSGSLQHPLDPASTEDFEQTLALYRQLDGFELADEPQGLLLLGVTDVEGIPVAAEPVEDAHDLEPIVCKGTPAALVKTGWVVGPRAATEAWARRAERAGARFALGREDRPDARRTLIATGAWTKGVTKLWGVTARTDVRARHILVEGGVNAVVAGGGEVFTLVGDVVGSTFDLDEPDRGQRVADVLDRARRFLVPEPSVLEVRVCPRPRTIDGRPLEQRVGETTWVCAGHGAWGISTGPASARRVASAMLADG